MAPAVVSPEAAARHGLSTNSNQGMYKNGATYGIEKKLLVAECYTRKKQEAGGRRPVLARIAEECRVSKNFVKTIEMELLEHGDILPPKKKKGPQEKIDAFDSIILFMLFLQEPSQSLSSYRDKLFELSGKAVHNSTISRWFTHSFAIKGSLQKPNLIPIDKFKPENI